MLSQNPVKILILFIFKADGFLYLYVDYRGLNALIIKNCHPLSLINETMNWLASVKIFIHLNL